MKARSGAPRRDTPGDELQEARIIAAYGRNFLADIGNGEPLPCIARGKRADIVCGDRVRLRRGEPALVEEVLPRRNALWRQDAWRSKMFAANLDLILVVTAVEPPPHLELVGRALLAAQAEDIDCAVIVNKCDLAGREALLAELEPLRRAGYAMIEVAARAAPERTIETLEPWLRGRTSLLVGASGVGKSTLVNTLVPGLELQTQAISSALNSGKHTTTATRMYALEGMDGGLLDSPGFQTFGVNQLSVSQLQHALPELRSRNGLCRFANCSHRHEPGCVVRAAVESGDIAASRYALYLRVLEELEAEAALRG